MMRRTVLAMLVVGLLACGAGSASAATVRTEEQTGVTNRATLVFQAAPGESNEVTVSRGETNAGLVELRVTDRDAAIEPGPGCKGGGGPDSTAVCTMHAPRFADSENCGRDCSRFLPGTGWEDSLSVDLGDGANSFDGSSLTGRYAEGFAEDVRSGPGTDTILTGGAEDRIEPGAGDDVVHAGAGRDMVVASPAPDGHDLYDLGPAEGNIVNYAVRTEPLTIGPGGGGADGENDRFEGANVILSGSGSDNLATGGYLYEVRGGPGNDTINAGPTFPGQIGIELYGEDGDDTMRGGDVLTHFIGGEGNDTMYGGTAGNIFLERKLVPTVIYERFALATTSNEPSLGDDVAIGGPSRNIFWLGAGNDRAEGGAGDDEIYGESGDDVLSGGAGNDLVAGEAGSDHLEGGEGNDRVLSGRLLEWKTYLGSRAMDGWSDSVDCGPGADFSNANAWDQVTNCETVKPTKVIDNGKLVRLRHGVTKMVVDAAGPGRLTISGPAIRRRSLALAPVDKAGAHSALVRISPRGGAIRRLHRRGQATVHLEVRFAPEGGPARAETRTVKLVRRP